MIQLTHQLTSNGRSFRCGSCDEDGKVGTRLWEAGYHLERPRSGPGCPSQDVSHVVWLDASAWKCLRFYDYPMRKTRYMRVSINGATPKSSIFMGCSPTSILGYTHVWKPPYQHKVILLSDRTWFPPLGAKVERWTLGTAGSQERKRWFLPNHRHIASVQAPNNVLSYYMVLHTQILCSWCVSPLALGFVKVVKICKWTGRCYQSRWPFWSFFGIQVSL